MYLGPYSKGVVIPFGAIFVYVFTQKVSSSSMELQCVLPQSQLKPLFSHQTKAKSIYKRKKRDDPNHHIHGKLGESITMGGHEAKLDLNEGKNE
ncbi:unnamed protein product [Ilex paraguariensis]|uniref:Uncharacterized protein n=1 Tax=Ilex paraguariensis TaxID=185542 RepID=A0ABC8RCQ6_9AQUA